jgi:hypothetical protein
MASELTDMTIDEISLVDEPANESARVVVMKARKPGANFKPCASCEDEDRCMEKGACAMEKSRRADTESAGSADADGAGSRRKYGANDMDVETLSKALEVAEGRLDDLLRRTETAEAALAEAQDVIKQRDAEIAALDGEAAEDDVLKSLPEAIRKRLEASEAEIAKMRTEKETSEAIAKARSIGVSNPDQIGPILMRVEKGATTADDAAALTDLLRSMAAVEKSSRMFSSVGSAAAVDGDPEAILAAKADEIRKARPTLTYAQAYAEAVESNPAVYTAYIAKRR